VFVIPQLSAPSLPTNLTLVSPNGGEIWPQANVSPTWSKTEGGATAEITITPDGGTNCEGAAGTQGSLPHIESTQQITWTKGAGVQGVDVEITRDDGRSWQTIGKNNAGTSMTWIVTPPGSPHARARVKDAAVTSRSDASDAPFDIPGGPTDVSPNDGLPRVAAFALRDRNPVRDQAHFKMDVPAATRAEVQVFDVRGRMLRSLLGDRVTAGRYDVVWDTRDARGIRAARGVYFVRARFGAFTVERKLVVLR
jgi:hypothetical protein